MRSSTLTGATLASSLLTLTSAHFILKHPESIGSRDSTSSDGPCGGFTPDISEGSDQLVDVHVDGEAMALRLTHSRATWLFRATLDEDAEAEDATWERLYPNTVQSGLGDFCLPTLTYPGDWAGKRGVISVVSSADDGQLYQCIAANFIEGSSDAPSSCTNASIEVYPTDDARLDALVGEGSGGSDDDDGGDDSHEGHETTTGAAPEATEEGGAAAALQAWSTRGLAGFVSVVSMVVFGGALMI